MKPMRLIDLHCNWLQQYATETTVYDPSFYAEVPGRLRRLEGYLLGTSAAVLACARKPEEWAKQADAWRSLGALLARYGAEFTGRLLCDPADVARWRVEPADGLCWGVLAVAGFDFLIREPRDLDRLPALFERGVRVFQLVASHAGRLAGSDEPGDDRGLTELGRAFLARLAELATAGETGPRPIVDLAHLNSPSRADVLHWVEKDLAATASLLLVNSHGGWDCVSPTEPGGSARRDLQRLRALGGVIGLTPCAPSYPSPAELHAVIETIASTPFEGRAGYEGIAIGTDLLGIDQPSTGLDDVGRIARWIGRAFDRPTAAALTAGNARRLLLRSVGAAEHLERPRRE
jgi:membrane dipeptidase